MNLFIEDHEIQEIKIEDILNSNDNGKVIKNRQGESRGIEKADLTKEIIAHDTVDIGSVNASKVHDVTQAGASQYSNGLSLPDDAKARVLAHKHDIADTAIAKLMDTLGLFNPEGLEQMEIVKSASMLAGIVDKVTSRDGGNKGNQVVLNLYAPKQNSLDRYNVIEVG